MPTINLNRNEVEKLIGKKLTLEKLKDRISMLGTDLEEINDDEIIVEVFPNRPDLLSEQGFGRALSSFVGAKKGLREYKVVRSNEKVIIDKSVDKVRPYTVCAIVKNLKFNDDKIKEVVQIQEKLHITYGRNRKKVAIGIYPFEKIKTPIRYLAKNPKDIKFKPLEGKLMDGNEILEKHPAGKEYGHLLKDCNLYPIFVDSSNKILSMPPIINSEETGRVTEKTKDVFIECSGFNYDILSKCLNIIVTALADMGGTIYSMELNYDKSKVISPNLNPESIKVNLDYVNKKLGLDLNESKFKELLERMGYDYKNEKVLIPCYRADILHPIDIVEDVAIAYGYENFKEEIPNVATIGKEDELGIFRRKLSNLLTGFGLLETNSYNLISDKDLDKMEIELDRVEISNPVNVEYNVLRNWMIPSLLKILSENKHNEYPQNLFEIGNVFSLNKEFFRVGIVLCHEKANFTEIKQILDSLMLNLGLSYSIKSVKHESFIEGRVGRVSVKGKDIAYIGEINPKVLSNFDLQMPVAALEINVSELFKLCNL